MTDLLPNTLPGAVLPDQRLVALDQYCREIGGQYRVPGAVLDRDPDAIEAILDLPGVQFAQYAYLPAPYRPDLGVPLDLIEAARTCLGSIVVCERFSYGDPGVMLASPGPSLSGGVIEAIAEPAQADRYYRRLAVPGTYTCFGLTEPHKGSAVAELETSLSPAPDGAGWLLNGEKRYIGNGSRAQIGVVFCRRAPGPLGIEAVLLDTASSGVIAEPLPMLGLRGARISRLRFENVRIPSADLLGAALSPARRGLRGALQILYRFRPGIAAMALGCAQAVCDHVAVQRPTLPKSGRLRLEELLDQVATVRHLTHLVGADLDQNVVNVPRIGATKARAARLAEAATLLAVELLGPNALVDSPWLEKVYRDVRAFELMEGTSNLHQLSVFQGVLRGTFLLDRDTP